MDQADKQTRYRGRLAPSPTGYLHAGHAQTFWIAHQRALNLGGDLILRNDDLDNQRCKSAYVEALFEDLQWFGFKWSEGPDRGGSFGPYSQSQRQEIYRAALRRLQLGAFVYPCSCSRKDIQSAVSAPHAADDELIYPGSCRHKTLDDVGNQSHCWRFRVVDGEKIQLNDGHFGPVEFVAGKDFGDFVVWRPDGICSYQLATVVDDCAMKITEVVRGADLLVSTARQILIYRALGFPVPSFYHCPLMLDEKGQRMAKRQDAMSLRQLRQLGMTPEQIRESYFTAMC